MTTIHPTKTTYPPVEQMLATINAHGYEALSAQLGVSSNAIRKYLRHREVELPDGHAGRTERAKGRVAADENRPALPNTVWMDLEGDGWRLASSDGDYQVAVDDHVWRVASSDVGPLLVMRSWVTLPRVAGKRGRPAAFGIEVWRSPIASREAAGRFAVFDDEISGLALKVRDSDPQLFAQLASKLLEERDNSIDDEIGSRDEYGSGAYYWAARCAPDSVGDLGDDDHLNEPGFTPMERRLHDIDYLERPCLWDRVQWHHKTGWEVDRSRYPLFVPWVGQDGQRLILRRQALSADDGSARAVIDNSGPGWAAGVISLGPDERPRTVNRFLMSREFGIELFSRHAWNPGQPASAKDRAAFAEWSETHDREVTALKSYARHLIRDTPTNREVWADQFSAQEPAGVKRYRRRLASAPSLL